MKRNRFMIIFASALTFASVGTSTVVTAQTSNEMQPTYCPGSTPESRFGPGEPNWRTEFEGIDLSSEQVNCICELKATLNQEAFGPDFSLETLLEWANTGSQGEQEFSQSSIANAIRGYNAGVQQVLTSEQYQQWQRNGGGER